MVHTGTLLTDMLYGQFILFLKCRRIFPKLPRFCTTLSEQCASSVKQVKSYAF